MINAHSILEALEMAEEDLDGVRGEATPLDRWVPLLYDELRALERIVELRFFAGLTVEETAEALGISKATVKRDWALAKAWMAHEMAQADGS